MRANRLIPIAALAFAFACTENASNPAENTPELAKGGQDAFAKGGNDGVVGNPAYHSSLYQVATNGELSHTFKQTGLGSFTTVAYTLVADAIVTGFCENPGGGKPQGTPFPTTGTVADDFDQDPRNGSITATITLTPFSVDCQPPGGNPHDFIVTDVSWDNIRFCWGGSSSTSASATFQGPRPPGSEQPMVIGAEAEGTPLSGGNETSGGGIFAAEDCTP
jgi:hypothetical protein